VADCASNEVARCRARCAIENPARKKKKKTYEREGGDEEKGNRPECDEGDGQVGRGDGDQAEEGNVGGGVTAGPEVYGHKSEGGGEEGEVEKRGEELKRIKVRRRSNR
jgi:hypothetical protein